MNIPWVEKYRPSGLESINGHDSIKDSLSNYKGIPNLIFYGPPGTGKTSTILALAKNFYKTNLKFKSMVMELNASDERSLDIVNEKIKSFVCSSSILGVTNDIKIIILDEADALTIYAQIALRRIMEKYSKTVRVCLCCNYIHKISSSLQSRCTKFKFEGIHNSGMLSIIKKIQIGENLDIKDDALDLLIKVGDGDARRVISILQSTSNKTLTRDRIYSCIGQPSDTDINFIYGKLFGNIGDSYSIIKEIMIDKGFSLIDIINGIYDKLLHQSNIYNLKYVLDSLADIEYNLSIGASDYIQLTRMVSCFHLN